MKILITGSGTLLGNSVSKLAIKKKLKIICSYRTSYPLNLKKNKIKIEKLDLSKNFKLSFRFDCLVHCASGIPSDNLSDKKMFKTNFCGFKRLLDTGVKNGLSKVIMISTMSVYGNIKSNIVSNQTKLRPTDSYGKSKLLMENYLVKLCKKNKIDFFILRLPAIVGLKSDYNFISKVLKKIKNNEKVTFSNPNLKFNNFIHVRNLSEIIIKLIHIKGSKILNIACKRPMKLKSIIKKIYLHEKKVDTSKVVKSKSKGFSIKLDNYLVKNFHILSTKKTLELFLKENKAT